MSRLCLKVGYPDQASAEGALEDARHEHRGRRKVESRAYFHEPCNAWHLTSQRRKP